MSVKPKINALILEDNVFFLDNIVRTVSEIDCIGTIFEAGTISKGLEIIFSEEIDLLIADVSLPDGSGLTLIKAFQAKNKNGLSIVNTVLSNSNTIVEAIEAGAVGYLHKDDTDISIRNSVELALNGKSPISAGIARQILSMSKTNLKERSDKTQVVEPDPANGDAVSGHVKNPLTPREMQILMLISKGITARDVSKTLNISENTVHVHAQNIYKKLNASNKSEAVFEATSLGILKW